MFKVKHDIIDSVEDLFFIIVSDYNVELKDIIKSPSKFWTFLKKNYENKPIYPFLVLTAYYNGIKKPSKVVL